MSVTNLERHRPRKQGKRGRNNGEQLPRLDQQLNRARNENLLVTFHLAAECEFTDENGQVDGLVLEVDKYAIKVRLVKEDNEESFSVWLSKSWIVGTEIDGL